MRIYFMGIAGTAMGQAALLMRALGHQVLGADSGVYPPMSNVLREAGIDFFDGYSPQRLAALAPDLVVVGNAMSRGHPEVEWLLETRAFPMTSLPALIGSKVLPGRHSLVVAGTHGKTTTTAIAAFILLQAGNNPGWLVGGAPRDLPAGTAPGLPNSPFIIEGDEYDSAFFDKRSKFIHYQPHVLLLNNLEFDHGDIFRDLEDIQRSFRHLLRLVPRNGLIVANGDDPHLAELLAEVTWAPVCRVGMTGSCDWRIENFEESTHGCSFTLTDHNNPPGAVEMRLACAAHFNARNAAMALCGVTALQQGSKKPDSPPSQALPTLAQAQLLPIHTLASFQGVQRRQEIFYEDDRRILMEDFGHHPTALAQTLQSLRQRFPAHHLAAAFEPRSNTAVTNRFQDAFTKALSLADSVFIAPLHRPERLLPEQRLDIPAITQQLRQQHINTFSPSDLELLFDDLCRFLQIEPPHSSQAGEPRPSTPNLLVLFSNGAFGGFRQKFLTLLHPNEPS